MRVFNIIFLLPPVNSLLILNGEFKSAINYSPHIKEESHTSGVAPEGYFLILVGAHGVSRYYIGDSRGI